MAMGGTWGEGLEDEEVEGSMEHFAAEGRFGGLGHWSHCIRLDVLKEYLSSGVCVTCAQAFSATRETRLLLLGFVELQRDGFGMACVEDDGGGAGSFQGVLIDLIEIEGADEQ